MAFIKATDTAGLEEGKTKRVMVDGKDILFSNVGGTVYAISNVCPHMGGLLSEGKVEGGVVTCPRHGSKFDLKTGKNVGEAKVLFAKIKVKDETSYPVKVEGNDVLIDLED